MTEFLPHSVRGGALYAPAVHRDNALDSGGVVASGELLEFRFLPLDHRNGQELLVDCRVHIEDHSDLGRGLRETGVGSVAFLPQELAGPQERSGCLNSHRTTLHHWFSLRGRSRWLRIHLAKAEYMIVSLVGRIAIGLSRAVRPDRVTQATSGAKPSMWLFSALRDFSDTNRRK